MKILIVCSGNVRGFNFQIHQSFIYEQIETIRNEFSIEYETFFIEKKGSLGYLFSLILLLKKIYFKKYDLIHAHYGLSGFISVLQPFVPVILSLHGSDINNKKHKFFSLFARKLSKSTVFVSVKMTKDLKLTVRDFIIPCGVNLENFRYIEKNKARSKINFEDNNKYVLFPSRFDNKIKNFSLAENAVSLANMELIIIELNNKTRAEVNLLLNAVDLLVLTSYSEGSPQVIKEAMACNCPIVSTDVGDVKEIIGSTEGCYISSFKPEDVAEKIKKALEFGQRTNGRERIKHLDNKIIAGKIYKIYQQVIQENN